ncbi:arsenite methyltransferase [Methanonatronarchaeum sp. AMET-Sl]|uniref:arsenite methyltransferase n=1 Tax=Methanonatronarchaeum sp. AMET-Sl TaxID=3037654 RepID=UPI00244E1486|nr:arsenite methyltransferase [Methanonatronarchaeum sp. AMET-Sl]WGI18111.1 arsenite methyltransferase [Methanonatronarchaeum sp. AMET-Sl]
MKKEELKEFINKEYSEIARNNDGCCQSSCCETDPETLTREVGYSQTELQKIPQKSIRGLGCGNTVKHLGFEEGKEILDLGSGLGIDVFLAAEKIGSEGRVVGLDSSKEMVQKASKIAEENHYKNVSFEHGEMEKIPFEDESFDAVISNCVINLSIDKKQTFQEIYRVLKPKGKILISDIVTEDELPQKIRENPEKWSSCIGGAIPKKEYLKLIENTGFKEIKTISQSKHIPNQKIDTKLHSLQIEAHK